MPLKTWTHGLRAACAAGLLALPLALQPVAAQTAAKAPAEVPVADADRKAAPPIPDNATVVLNKRRIVYFRATLLGDTPAERAAMAQVALDDAVARGGPGLVSRATAGDTIRFQLDGNTLFYLVADDITGPRSPAMLEVAAQKVEARLSTAVREAREASDPRHLATAAALSAVATLLAYALLRAVLAARRWALARLDQRLQQLQATESSRSVIRTYADHAQSGARFGIATLTWLLVALLVDIWVTFVLRQFAYTRPWGERSTEWLLQLFERFALGIAGALPGLLTAGLIFLIARLLTRANTAFMQRVERGELHVGWLDKDTAGPTRRLSNFVVWLFALAMAYPYLPGADSESFKGVTVLAGLMLSLGASGVVGQAMSGLSLMYAKALRVGEYVRIGDTEGTVMAVGLFATKVHTGMGEEVSLPSTVVFGQPIRNFSRLVQDGQFVLSTAVTIGYGTPWRQVHAMLLEAARRTPGVAADPAPYVVQTALSDFYAEYRLCAQADRGAPRRRVEAMNQLHAHIQDVFNENGVQIMSPHYMADPPEPLVVAPRAWAPGLAREQAPPSVRKI